MIDFLIFHFQITHEYTKNTPKKPSVFQNLLSTNMIFRINFNFEK